MLLEHAPGEAERIADETRHIDQLRRESLEATLAELIDVTCERHLRLLSLHGEIYRRYHRVIHFHDWCARVFARYVEVTSWEDWMRALLQEHRADIGVASIDIAAFLVAGTIIDVSARAVDTAPEWLFLAAVSRRPATPADELPAPGLRTTLTHHRQGERPCPPIRTIPRSTGKNSRR